MVQILIVSLKRKYYGFVKYSISQMNIQFDLPLHRSGPVKSKHHFPAVVRHGQFNVVMVIPFKIYVFCFE